MMVNIVYVRPECYMTYIVFQGYATLAQVNTGLHMRERSRAFIIAEAAQPSNRVLFINAGQSCCPR